jgi:Domain of unknown function (DUF397)
MSMCKDPVFKKSSRSMNNGACVEVARGERGVLVRDSKAVNGPVLDFPTEAWKAFIADICAGRLVTDSQRICHD